MSVPSAKSPRYTSRSSSAMRRIVHQRAARADTEVTAHRLPGGLLRGRVIHLGKNLGNDFLQRWIFDGHVFDRVGAEDGRHHRRNLPALDAQPRLGRFDFQHEAEPFQAARIPALRPAAA